METAPNTEGLAQNYSPQECRLCRIHRAPLEDWPQTTLAPLPTARFGSIQHELADLPELFVA